MRRKEEVTRKTIALAVLYAVLFSAGLVGIINWMDYYRGV